MILIIVVEIIEVAELLNISNSAGFPWAECNLSENRRLHIADSIGLRRTKRSTKVHRYEFELVTNDMPIEEGQSIMAKLSRAVDDTLLFIHPRMSYSNGLIPVEGITVNGAHAAGVSTVSVTCTEIWQLKSGDYIQFDNDSKVNQVVEDTLLQVGASDIELTNPIRKAVSDGDGVIADGVTWALSSDGVIFTDMQASDGQDIQVVLSAVEQL